MILVAIIPQYRDTRYWYQILTLISGYDVTNIGTPDIVPDIDPNIRYNIGDMRGYLETLVVFCP